jgi:hypothetical protein
MAIWLAAVAAVGFWLPAVIDDLPEDLGWGLPFALVGLAIAVPIAFASPRTLLVFAFALLVYVRPEPAPVDVVFVLLIIVGVLSWRFPTRVPAFVAVPLAAYAVLSILSSVNAGDGVRALRFELITLYLVVLAVWLTGALADAGVARRAMKVYVLAAVASAAAGTIALEVGFPGASHLLFDAFRAQALFKDPNVFGAFLVPAVAVVVEELQRPRLLGWRRPWLVAALVVLVAGLFFAFSRGAWLSAVIAAATVVLVTVWRNNGRKAAIVSLVGLATATLVGIGLLVATGSLEFFESRSSFTTYDRLRFGAQTSAFEHATDHVFGYGPGQVESALPQSAHSLYARVSYEQGLPGTFALALVLLATLYCAISLAVRDRDVYGIGSAALLGSWVGLLANSVFIDTLHWRHLWIVAALIWLGYAQRFRTESSPGPGDDRVIGPARSLPYRST